MELGLCWTAAPVVQALTMGTSVHVCDSACICSLVCSQGEEALLYDGRPNAELLLATGTVEAGNPAGWPGTITETPDMWLLKMHFTPEEASCYHV